MTNELYNNNGNIKKNAWKNIDNHKRYAEALGERLGYTKPEHWYSISHKIIKQNKGGGLLSHYYNDSPILFVQTVIKLIYPEYEWVEWNFNKTSQHFWDSITNQTKYMDWLFKELGYNKMEDWYQLNINKIRDNNIGGLLKIYKSSHINLLAAVYPKYTWLEWKFQCTSKGFWKKLSNHKIYAAWLGKELGYTEPEHWYNITQDIICDNYGRGMLTGYNGSPCNFLRAVYPDYIWLEWKFNHTSNGFWQDLSNHKIYADWLGKELGYTEPEHWYNITLDVINNNYGSGIMVSYYNSSPIQFLRAVYPDYGLLEWKFGMCSIGFWKNLTNHKIYAEWLGKELGYTELKHWYNITQDIIHNNNGCGMLNCYNSSPIQFLKTVYPDYVWLEWKFNYISTGFWENISNHKIYAEWLGKELGYTELKHWYNITQDIIHNNNGCGMLNYYNGSPTQFLKTIYPDYVWLEWKFKSTSNGFWQDLSNQKIYAEWLGKELGYTKPDDWYSITSDIIKGNFGSGITHIYKSYTDIPKLVYPNYNWEDNKFCVNNNYSKIQIQWLNFIQSYNNITIQHAENEGEFVIPDTRYKKRADGYCKETNTIYEFHGDYWHGNPKVFLPTEINKSTHTTFGELYQKTLERECYIREMGYNLVIMWEYDWLKTIKSVRVVQKKYRLLRK